MTKSAAVLKRSPGRFNLLNKKNEDIRRGRALLPITYRPEPIASKYGLIPGKCLRKT